MLKPKGRKSTRSSRKTRTRYYYFNYKDQLASYVWPCVIQFQDVLFQQRCPVAWFCVGWVFLFLMANWANPTLHYHKKGSTCCIADKYGCRWMQPRKGKPYLVWIPWGRLPYNDVLWIHMVGRPGTHWRGHKFQMAWKCLGSPKKVLLVRRRSGTPCLACCHSDHRRKDG